MNNNITVLGIGRLGLGLALLIEKEGYNVCGVDIFPEYVKCLNDKTYKTKEPEYENLLKNSKNFHATTNLEEGLNFSDIVFIIVQTPNSGGERFYDHTILSNLLMKINKYKVKNKDIIIEQLHNKIEESFENGKRSMDDEIKITGIFTAVSTSPYNIPQLLIGPHL